MALPDASIRASRRWLWLLILPWIGVLLVPVYNIDQPRLMGLPFFYWYQLMWVLISAVLTAIVYVKTKSSNTARKAAP